MKDIKQFIMGFICAIILIVPVTAGTIQKQIEVTSGVDIYVDNVQFNPTDVNGNKVDTFIHNGTTYLPVRAISKLFNKPIHWDNDTRSVYLGDKPIKATWVGEYKELYTYTVGSKQMSHNLYEDINIPRLTLSEDGTYTYSTNWYAEIIKFKGTWKVDQNNFNKINLSRQMGLMHDISFERISDKEIMLIIPDHIRVDNVESGTSHRGDVYKKQ